MNKNRQRKKVIWLGATSDELGWLLSRISLEADVTVVDDNLRSLDFAPEHLHTHCRVGSDRIVVACADRLGYPLGLIAWLQRNYPEVPLAMAAGTWWDGAGRTGIRQPCHLTIPWYRWWDSWTDWIHGHPARLYSPCATTTTHIGASTQPVHRLGLHGQVIAGRNDMAETWALFAQATGCTVETNLLSDKASAAESELNCDLATAGEPSISAPKDWILWDDSCLDTANGPDAVGQVASSVRRARQENPSSIILCALSIPRWSTWKQALEVGADELVVKPAAGFDFGRVVSKSHSPKSQ